MYNYTAQSIALSKIGLHIDNLDIASNFVSCRIGFLGSRGAAVTWKIVLCEVVLNTRYLLCHRQHVHCRSSVVARSPYQQEFLHLLLVLIELYEQLKELVRVFDSSRVRARHPV